MTLLAEFSFRPESPRLLISKGKREKANKILRKMVKVNGKPTPMELDFSPCCVSKILMLTFAL